MILHPLRSARAAKGRWFLIIGAAPLLALLLIPLAALLLKATPSVIVHYLGDRATMQAIALSISTSSVSVLLTITLGTPLAYLLARSRFPGRTMVDAIVDLPTVLPPAVAGIALLIAFGPTGHYRR